MVCSAITFTSHFVATTTVSTEAESASAIFGEETISLESVAYKAETDLWYFYWLWVAFSVQTTTSFLGNIIWNSLRMGFIK